MKSLKSLIGLKLATVSAAVAIWVLLLLSFSSANVGQAAPASAAQGINGAELFAAKCAGCHGKNGRGLPNWRAKGQPDFADVSFQKSRTDAQLAESLANGKGKFMPAWKDKLSGEQINALVGQVRAFGKKK
ncbi:MAG TPA: c-type cytochrome [Blastocatellia bacterium]|nr:c-type cytochrome [Blastocatellia bacterium]